MQLALLVIITERDSPIDTNAALLVIITERDSPIDTNAALLVIITLPYTQQTMYSHLG